MTLYLLGLKLMCLVFSHIYMLPVGLALPVAEPDLGGYSLSWREIGIFKHLR